MEWTMDLNQSVSFVAVIETGSFAAAARELDIPRSTVSARVAALEQRLGARLLRRTTRSVALTDDGRAYYDQIAPALRVIRAAEQSAVSTRGELRGTIRLSIPLDFPGEAIAAAIASFRCAHPHVSIHVYADNESIDFVAQNFDLAIRGGPPRGDELVAKKIGSFRFGAFGRTKNASRGASALRFASAAGSTWSQATRLSAVASEPAVVSNSFALLKELALAGAGIAILPAHMCNAEVDSGTLVEIEGGPALDASLYLVHPSRNDITARVRVFARHLAQALARPSKSGAAKR
jgi:DNA-binding transcriptional LysR family regulator